MKDFTQTINITTGILPMDTNPSGDITQSIEYTESYSYIVDIKNELSKSTGAIIMKENDCISGSEIDKKCKVYFSTQEGLKFAFICTCDRKHCCCCTSLRIILRHLTSPEEDPDVAKIYLELDKSYSLNCCLCKSDMKVKLFENNNIIGKIKERCKIYSKKIDIIDENNVEYNIIEDSHKSGDNQQYNKYEEYKFKIKRKNEIVGYIKKTSNHFSQNFPNSDDKIKITFPPKALPEEKLLIICGCLFLNYQLYS